MTFYHRAGGSRNTDNVSARSRTPATLSEFVVPLTRGGQVIQRKRPDWSSSVANAAAALAGIGGQECMTDAR
jgi:hypothetical protein